MIFSLLYAFFMNEVTNGDQLHPNDNLKSKLLLIRGILGVPGFTAAVVGSYLLPSRIYVVLANCNIIFAIVINCIIYKKPPRMMVLVFIMTYIAGVILMVNPQWFGLGSNDKNGTDQAQCK